MSASQRRRNVDAARFVLLTFFASSFAGWTRCWSGLVVPSCSVEGPAIMAPGPGDNTPRDAPAKGLWAELTQDSSANRGGLWGEGGRAMFVHRFQCFGERLRPGVRRPLCRLAGRLMHRYVRNVYGIDIDHSVRAGMRLNVSQREVTVLGATVIGNDCVLRSGVFVGPDQSGAGGPLIGDGVDVGAGAVIMGAVNVGSGATIGPNAVITVDVPAGTTVCVAPARSMIMPEARKLSTRPEPQLL